MGRTDDRQPPEDSRRSLARSAAADLLLAPEMDEDAARLAEWLDDSVERDRPGR